MTEFNRYQRTQIAELRPWQPGEDMSAISIATVDAEAGSPKVGDMIARNPKNHDDQWLVAAQYFADNFAPIAELRDEAATVTSLRTALLKAWQQRDQAYGEISGMRIVEAALVRDATRKSYRKGYLDALDRARRIVGHFVFARGAGRVIVEAMEQYRDTCKAVDEKEGRK